MDDHKCLYIVQVLYLQTTCRLWGCKNRRDAFPVYMLYKATKPSFLVLFV